MSLPLGRRRRLRDCIPGAHWWWTAVFAQGLVLAVAAQAENEQVADAGVQEAERRFSATFRSPVVRGVAPAPIDGLFEVTLADQIVYFAPDKGLLILGEIWTADGRSLTAETLARSRAERLSKLSLEPAIALGFGSRQVVEFVDPECPHCARYDAWVRGRTDVTRRVFFVVDRDRHPNAVAKAVHVLCSPNPSAALADVYAHKIPAADLRSCEDGTRRLAAQESAARSFGVGATPTLAVGDQVLTGFDPSRIANLLEAPRP